MDNSGKCQPSKFEAAATLLISRSLELCIHPVEINRQGVASPAGVTRRFSRSNIVAKSTARILRLRGFEPIHKVLNTLHPRDDPTSRRIHLREPLCHASHLFVS